MREIVQLNYGAHEALVASARAKAEIWRLVAGIFTLIAVWVFLANSVANMVVSWIPPAGHDAFWEATGTGATPGAVFFLLVQIGLLIPATGLAAALIHRRAFWELIGAPSKALSQFVLVLCAQVALFIVLTILPPYGFGEDSLVPGLAFGSWLVLLPLALLAVFFQCAAEEFAFRGYLQQQLAARFQSPVIWILIPSALFAFGHYDPSGAGENALTIALLAGLFGILLADITARAGTLGPAVAIHVSNNVLAMLFVGMPENLSGLALYVMPFGFDDVEQVRAWLPVDAVSMIVSWLLARLVLQR